MKNKKDKWKEARMSYSKIWHRALHELRRRHNKEHKEIMKEMKNEET